MNNERRWLESVLKAAEESTVVMPWARGTRRKEMISRRIEMEEPDVLSA
ncbi:hypothetical protein [Aliiruegeria lutimaris]|uniref:Uncharacterized protein n=1 Tax=Aliiruegeria lutimaris TaxID=571298 RepID=A0A1G9A3J1_9RHOB|nr:hypothetical protein [Aliiruegeria lutimaris]SDK21886.1 hypothetical protein SAMN04488026_103425 [Aliiruegeria lutimaris]